MVAKFKTVSRPKKEKEIEKTTDGVLKEATALPKLEAGQKYFETPDGEILVGEAGKDQLWSRKMNNGKGGWANPKR